MTIAVEIVHLVGVDGARDHRVQDVVDLSGVWAWFSGAEVDDAVGIDVPVLA